LPPFPEETTVPLFEIDGNIRGTQVDQIRDLLVDDLQDLLHAEMQLVQALPKMADAARNAKLKEAFEKHLHQTEGHVERLKKAFELLGEKAQPKPCKGMKGLIDEGEEVIEENGELEDLGADLALIGAAQKVEHYEISGYGTAHCLARQIGECEVAKLLSHTLGEEERADYLLTTLSKPLLQDATLIDNGSGTPEIKISKSKAQKA
jgi:Mn-containing catalase